MIKSELLVRIIDFQQPLEVKRKRVGTIRSLLAQRAKLNHPLFKSAHSLSNKNHFRSQCLFRDSPKQHFCEYLQNPAQKYQPNTGESIDRQLKIYNNNYKAFPSRSLLVKPHVVKNTAIRLNLFQKQIEQPDERYNTLMAKTLQLKFTDQSGGKTKTIQCAAERKRDHQRIASAKVVSYRKHTAEFQPWEIAQDAQDNYRF